MYMQIWANKNSFRGRLRVYINGKFSAFQADYMGSIPITRFKIAIYFWMQ